MTAKPTSVESERSFSVGGGLQTKCYHGFRFLAFWLWQNSKFDLRKSKLELRISLWNAVSHILLHFFMDSYTFNIYFLLLLNKFSFLLLFNYFCLLIAKVIKQHYTCRALQEKVNMILKTVKKNQIWSHVLILRHTLCFVWESETIMIAASCLLKCL